MKLLKWMFSQKFNRGSNDSVNDSNGFGKDFLLLFKYFYLTTRHVNCFRVKFIVMKCKPLSLIYISEKTFKISRPAGQKVSVFPTPTNIYFQSLYLSIPFGIQPFIFDVSLEIIVIFWLKIFEAVSVGLKNLSNHYDRNLTGELSSDLSLNKNLLS